MTNKQIAPAVTLRDQALFDIDITEAALNDIGAQASKFEEDVLSLDNKSTIEFFAAITAALIVRETETYENIISECETVEIEVGGNCMSVIVNFLDYEQVKIYQSNVINKLALTTHEHIQELIRQESEVVAQELAQECHIDDEIERRLQS